uniref:Mitochondrial inner membrane protein OXA1L (inferred by orthology to a human protein) n=1 Tax=Strongyloides venezuelensis TaxID=75913 RepID=A0A0K0F5W6_STRVS
MLHFSRNGGRFFSNTVYRSLTQYPTLDRKTSVLNIVQCRGIGTKDIFTSEPLKNFTVPDAPLHPLPTKSLTEMLAEKQSILSEMGLFEWYKPTGYIRYAMEYCHLSFDIPWWGAIAATTITLRLLLFYVQVLTQRNVAIQSHYRDEMTEFQRRMRNAQLENDFRSLQLILLEQNTFMKEKGIKQSKQLFLMLANSSIFMSQFWAVKKFVTLSYPGFETGGLLWLQDLTIPDPLYVLQIATSLTTYGVLKHGSEVSTDIEQIGKRTKYLLLFGLPATSFVVNCFFPSAIGIYWLTSNCMSLIYIALFKIGAVRGFLKIPNKAPPTETQKTKHLVKGIFELFSSPKGEVPINEIRKRDMENFEKASKRAPIKKK